MTHRPSFIVNHRLISSAIAVAIAVFSMAASANDAARRMGSNVTCAIYQQSLRVPGACQAGRAAYRAGEYLRDTSAAAGRRVGRKINERRCRDGKGRNCR